MNKSVPSILDSVRVLPRPAAPASTVHRPHRRITVAKKAKRAGGFEHIKDPTARVLAKLGIQGK